MRNEIVTRLAEGNGHDLSLWETLFLLMKVEGHGKTVNIWATGIKKKHRCDVRQFDLNVSYSGQA